MKILSVDKDKVTVELTKEEVGDIYSALNEQERPVNLPMEIEQKFEGLKDTMEEFSGQ